MNPVSNSKLDEVDIKYIMSHYTNLSCLAPEVLLQRFIGFKTQVFSFGYLLYVITHGFNPFAGEDVKSLQNCYLDDTKPFIDPDLDPKIYYLI